MFLTYKFHLLPSALECPSNPGRNVLGRKTLILFNPVRRYHNSTNQRNKRSFLCLQSSRTFAVQERGLKGQSRRNFDTVNNAQRRKHFLYLFLLREPSQNKRWGNIQKIPFKHADHELELSYRCNNGWHCKQMISCFFLKFIYHNSWFGQFFYFTISKLDMFCRLESLVRGISQKLSIGLK